MTRFVVTVEEEALNALKQIPNPFKKSIFKKISSLEAIGSRTSNIKKLKGFKDGFRLRVGDYRVLFVKNDEASTIKVYTIGHRKDVYKD